LKLAARLLASLLFVSLIAGAGPASAQENPTATPLPILPTDTPTSDDTSANGDLQGTVSAVQQVDLAPRTEGTLSQLVVGVGSQVQKNDTLAILDPGTIVGQLTNARAGVISAHAQLQSVEQGARPEDIAASQAQVASAQDALNGLARGNPQAIQTAQDALTDAQAKLDALLAGPTDDVRQAAQSAVASDTSQVQSAQAALDAFTSSGASDLQSAQSAVTSDKATVAAASAALDNLHATNPSDLQAAESAVNTDSAQVTSARAALVNLGGTNAGDLQQDLGNVATDQALVNAAQAAIDQANSPPDAQAEAAQQLVAAAQAAVDSAAATLATLQNPVPTSGTATVSSACQQNAAGTVLSQDACSAAITAAQSAQAAAQQQLTAAQSSLQQLTSGGPPATAAHLQATLVSDQQQLATDQARLNAEQNGVIGSQQAAAQATLATAVNQLTADQAKLDSLHDGTFQSELATDQSALVAAQQRLAADQATLDALANGGQSSQQAQLQSTLAAAQQKLLSDQATLKVLVDGPLPTDVQQARDQVAQAQQALVEAQNPGAQTDLAEQQAVIGQMTAALEGTAQPYTDSDLETAVASLASAQASMAEAQETLSQTFVVAPFAGVVGSMLEEIGTDVTSSTPILTLSSADVQVDVTIGQEDLGQVAVGQPVGLTVPAYPDVVFPAHITLVAPVADSTSHTFEVRLVPDTQDPRLLPGMFADVSLTQSGS
jgi:multidrug efflux pump subunit AcrA (membrane-fusion protein)